MKTDKVFGLFEMNKSKKYAVKFFKLIDSQKVWQLADDITIINSWLNCRFPVL